MLGGLPVQCSEYTDIITNGVSKRKLANSTKFIFFVTFFFYSFSVCVYKTVTQMLPIFCIIL